MPRRIRQKPIPPASTTPAFLRTGFWLTVLSSAACAVSRQCCSTYSISLFSSAKSRAASAVRRETVRIVPSAGFMTALYAASTPAVSAAAKSLPSASSLPLSDLEKPRNRRDRITPELPLAPRRSAEAVLSAALVSVMPSALRSSVLAAESVMLIFVPVSPSGTGKTFSSLTFCLFRSISAAAESIIRLNAAPSMVLIMVYLRERPCMRA